MENKTRKIKLISRYFDFEINLRMESDKVKKLLQTDNAIFEIYKDITLIKWGHKGKYISISQANKIRTFFRKNDYNYFNKIELI